MFNVHNEKCLLSVSYQRIMISFYRGIPTHTTQTKGHFHKNDHIEYVSYTGSLTTALLYKQTLNPQYNQIVCVLGI